ALRDLLSFPYTTLFRSRFGFGLGNEDVAQHADPWRALGIVRRRDAALEKARDPGAQLVPRRASARQDHIAPVRRRPVQRRRALRSEEHTSELQSPYDLV